MVYQTGNMLLQTKQKLFYGKVNEVVVCQDLAAETKQFYLLQIIKDHDIAKKLVELYADPETRETYVTTFSWKEDLIIVYPYQKERPLDQFFSSDILTLAECEKLCMDIVVECIATHIPLPILYLQFAQKQIHTNSDKSVYMGYRLDLEELDTQVSQEECVLICGKLLFDLLDRFSNVKTMSYRLLQKKSEHRAYKRFTELYYDLKAAAVPLEKEGLVNRIKAAFRRNQDKIFRALLIICLIAAFITLICILTQAIFGDIPFIRIFINTFKQIGTESLLQ